MVGREGAPLAVGPATQHGRPLDGDGRVQLRVIQRRNGLQPVHRQRDRAAVPRGGGLQHQRIREVHHDVDQLRQRQAACVVVAGNGRCASGLQGEVVRLR